MEGRGPAYKMKPFRIMKCKSEAEAELTADALKYSLPVSTTSPLKSLYKAQPPSLRGFSRINCYLFAQSHFITTGCCHRISHNDCHGIVVYLAIK